MARFDQTAFSNHNGRVAAWSDAMKSIDVSAFYGLTALTVFYQFQLLFPVLSEYKLRELFYLYLFARVAVSYKIKLDELKLLIGVFLLVCFVVGAVTVYRFGLQMGMHGFTRFVNVALLAPLATVFVVNAQRLRYFLYIWLFAVLMGCLSAVYQSVGGDMGWLVGSYWSGRGSLTRYMTILGEPNVGGMAAAISLFAVVLLFNSRVLGTVIGLFAITLIMFSLSKAAHAAACVGILIFVGVSWISGAERRSIFSSLAWLLAPAVLLAQLLWLPDLRELFFEYTRVMAASLAGTGEYFGTSDGVVGALHHRLYQLTVNGIAMAYDQSDFYLLDVLFGSSYGLAGSAATQARGGLAVLPHNSFLEAFLVGGVTMLSVLVAVLLSAGRRLWRAMMSRGDALPKLVFCAYTLLVLFMIGYPVIYEPILGSIFWILVGASANLGAEYPAGEIAQDPDPATAA